MPKNVGPKNTCADRLPLLVEPMLREYTLKVRSVPVVGRTHFQKIYAKTKIRAHCRCTHPPSIDFHGTNTNAGCLCELFPPCSAPRSLLRVRKQGIPCLENIPFWKEMIKPSYQ